MKYLVWLTRHSFCFVLAFLIANNSGMPVCLAQVAYDAGFPSPGEYMITHYSTKDGLPANYFWTLYYSADGYLWGGSENGLTRYDGHDFHTISAANTKGWVGESRVDVICEDQAGNLWFGSNRPQTRRLYTFRHIEGTEDTVRLQYEEFLRVKCIDDRGLVVLKEDSVLLHVDRDVSKKYELPQPISEVGFVYVTGEDEFWIVSGDFYAFYSVDGLEVYGRLEKEIDYIFRDIYGEVMVYAKGDLFLYKQKSLIKTKSFGDSAIFRSQFDANKLWLNVGLQILSINSKEVESISINVSQKLLLGRYKVYVQGEDIFVFLMESYFRGRMYRVGERNRLIPVRIERFGAMVALDMVQDALGGFWFTTDAGILHVAPRKMHVYTVAQG